MPSLIGEIKGHPPPIVRHGTISQDAYTIGRNLGRRSLDRAIEYRNVRGFAKVESVSAVPYIPTTGPCGFLCLSGLKLDHTLSEHDKATL